SKLLQLPTFPGKPGCAGSSPGNPLGAAPVPIVPGVVVFGAPGWGRPGPGLMPVVEPVPVVDGPPGADEMPADPGLVVVVPTGGTPPMPGATPRGSCDQGHREQGRKTQFVSYEIFPVWSFSASRSLESRRSCPSLAMRSHRRLALAESGSRLQH